MRLLKICCSIGLFACMGAARPKEHVQVEERQTAADGITTGWVLTYDNPDPGQAWRRYPLRLVIARRGRVIRRLDITTIWKWTFWEGGQEVAVEAGPMHGSADCLLISVESGKNVGTFDHCSDDTSGAPEWVKALAP